MDNENEKLIAFSQFLFQIGVVNEKFLNSLEDKTNNDEVTAQLKEHYELQQDEIDDYFSSYQHFDQASVDHIDEEITKKIPQETIKLNMAVPIAIKDNKLQVAMANPMSYKLLNNLTKNSPLPIHPVLALQQDIEAMIRQIMIKDENIKHYAGWLNMEVKNQALHTQAQQEEFAQHTDAPINKLIDTIIADAIEQNASDIHIEYTRFDFRVRLRIAGGLVEIVHLPGNIANIVLRRLLILSKGDITELYAPQDTSFQYNSNDIVRNMRMSTLPTLSGYSIVLRILMQADFYQLEQLIVNTDAKSTICNFLDALNGMMLVTGPTSSGKTTTLYSALNYVDRPDLKTITMEDPVESEIPGTNQVEIMPDLGLDFADVIRSALRQNPDVLMVGEIRDTTSATMAMRAAITGIMVLGTLHAKNTQATALRLLDLDVDAAMVGLGLKLIVAQRLVRCICEFCKEKYTPTKAEEAFLAEQIPDYDNPEFYQGKGCQRCLNTGFHAVTSVYELLEIDDDIALAITTNNLKEYDELISKKLHLKHLINNAYYLASKEHITTVQEVIKLAL